MAKANHLNEYLEIQIEDLREGEEIPFSLHVHLPLGERLICLQHHGSFIAEGFIKKFKLKKFTSLFVQQKDEDVLRSYLLKHENRSTSLETSASASQGDLDPSTKARSELEISLQILAERSEGTQAELHLPQVALPTPEFNSKQHTSEEPAQVPEVTLPLDSVYDPDPQSPLGPQLELSDQQASRLQNALRDMKNTDAKLRGKSLRELRSLAKEIILAEERPSSIFSKLWQEVVDSEDAGHCGNVATFSVLFSMALGHSERGLLKDVAFAGLVHDLGLTQAPRDEIIGATKNEASPALKEHVSHTLFLLTQMAINPPERSIGFILQHHEKFNGSGYPRQSKNWEIQELSQALSMADIFDDMFHGNYDGRERTITEAFRDLMILEKSEIFPQHYNPDLFVKLVKWIQNQTQEPILDEALNIIEESLSESALNTQQSGLKTA